MSHRTATSATYDTRTGWLGPIVEIPFASRPATQPDGSAFEHLVRAVEAHASSEAESIAMYERLAANAPDAVTALLLRLIIEDEERHHRVLRHMGMMLRELDWTDAERRTHGPTSPEVVRAIRNAARDEHDVVSRFRDLAHQQSTLQDGAIALLLELMAMDSQKHERILEFVARRLEAHA